MRLAGAKARLRGAAEIDLTVAAILDKHHVGRYLKVTRVVREEHHFKQARRGRPGPQTAYKKLTKRRFDIEWSTDEDAVAYDHRSDGMYPLMTNDRSLSPAQVLLAHKGQPMIEKRFEQVKTVHESRPSSSRTRAGSRPCSPCTSSPCLFRPSSSVSFAWP